MSDQKLIYKQLALVQSKIKPIGKTSKNLTQKFNFRGIDTIYNAIHPLLAEAKIITTSKIINSIREERQTKTGSTLIYSIVDYEYTFHAEDGSSISTQVRGEGMDSGDKASNKSMAVAHKYAITQMFTIPYEGMEDPDSESHEVVSKYQEAMTSGLDKIKEVGSWDDVIMLRDLIPSSILLSKEFKSKLNKHLKEKGIKNPNKKTTTP